MDPKKLCSCSELEDLAIIGMGDPNGLDEQVFATLDLVQNHGEEQWWLYVSTCMVCSQNWMIAQEERIHDNYCLKRLDPETMQGIIDQSRWPADFIRFEQVLRLERQSGKVAQFLDPRSPALIDTANDLRRERPGIPVEDIAFALAISVADAARLFRKARLIDRFWAWALRR
jgi:hypothetical protein